MEKNEKYFKIVFVFISILPLLMFFHKYDNDYYYYFDQGRYLIEHNFKFPTSAYFVAYDGKFDFILQRWLSSVIFYLIFKYTGFIGIQILLWIITLTIEFLLYKVLININDNKLFCILLASLSTLFISIKYISIRPLGFMCIILLLEILILEKYIKNKNTKILLFLPLLSCLLMQFYSSFYIVFFIFLLPYIADFNVDLENKKINLFPYKKIPIILTGLLSFLTCIINPYGIHSLTYFLSTTVNLNKAENEQLKQIQSEMLESNIHNNVLPFLVIIGLILIFIFKQNKHLKLRYYFLIFGTLLMTLLQTRNSVLLFITSIIFLNYIIIDKKIIVFLYIFLLFTPISISCWYCSAQKEIDNNLEAIDWISDNYGTDNKIYTNINILNYAIYKKQKVYIDTRSEIYFKNLNHNQNYFTEFVYNNDGYYYDKFLKKYHPNFIINNKYKTKYTKNDSWEYEYNKNVDVINNTKMYKKVFETDYYEIYKYE